MSHKRKSTSGSTPEGNKSRRHKRTRDMHDWINYHSPHDTHLYPRLAAEVAQFYNRLRKINRNDFFEHLSTRINELKAQQDIVQTLYTRYEAEYLTLQQLSRAYRSSVSSHEPNRTSKIARQARVRIIASQTQRIEQERQVLDLVRSWRSYTSEWVEVMNDLFHHWEEIWDWYECGLYMGVHPRRPRWRNLPRIYRHIELLEELRALEVRAEFAMRGASEKGGRVFDLGASR